jgi:hypothetical protein
MFSKVPLGKNAILMKIFHAKKEHFAKGHLANLGGGWPLPPGSYAPVFLSQLEINLLLIN